MHTRVFVFADIIAQINSDTFKCKTGLFGISMWALFCAYIFQLFSHPGNISIPVPCQLTDRAEETDHHRLMIWQMKASEINGDSGAERNLWCLAQVNNVTMLKPYFR